MAASLTFTETGHLYHRDGQLVPSVTQVLELAGIDDFPYWIPTARQNRDRAAALGKAVHMCCHFLDENALDVETVDPRIAGYVWAYQKFRKKYSPRWSHVEQPMVNEAELAFAGTPDRIGTLTVKDQPLRFVVDIKTPQELQKYCALQTAGYYLLAGGDPLRAVLHLKADGEFLLIPHKNEIDIEVFRAALRVAHWRLWNGTKIR